MSRRKAITLTEQIEPTKRYRCPVRKFLALALADDVFVQQKEPKDFENRWIQTTATLRAFEISDDKKRLPIFRKLEGKRVSSSAIMTACSSNALIKDICEQCGYTESATIYTFRRGVANKLEGNRPHQRLINPLTYMVSAKTSTKRTQEALSHKGDRTWHAYAAPTISVDAQAIAYNEPEDNLYTDFTQSIAYTRDFGAPKPANSKVEVLSVPSKDVLKAVDNAHPSSRPEMILRKARREQYKIDREGYYKEAGRVNPALKLDDTSSKDQLDTETTEKPEKELTVSLCPRPSPDFKQIMKYNPLQARVIETLWGYKQASLAECIRPMMALANPEPFRALYPSPVMPATVDERCPYCEQDLTRFKTPKYSLHLLDCHCISNNAYFCFDCATFIDKSCGEKHLCPDFDLSN
jgi:hypothetical protein